MELLYFAWVRERIGAGQEHVEPPEGISTVADLVDWLATRSPGHAAALGDATRLRAAVDQKFVALDIPLGTAREVAIFPPVSGG